MHLSTGQLASVPQQLSGQIALDGSLVLTWQAPISDGYLPLTGYQAHCGGNWEEVSNTRYLGLQKKLEVLVMRFDPVFVDVFYTLKFGEEPCDEDQFCSDGKWSNELIFVSD